MSAFQYDPLAPGVANLTIDLCPYIDAFMQYQQDKTKDSLETYNTLRQELREEVQGINGQVHWENLFEKATQGLSQSDIEMIKTTPAFTYMKNNYVEILKNLMDEAILSRKNEPIELQFNIDYTSNLQTIDFIFTDTGRGFPLPFLENISSPTSKSFYVMSAGSEKSSRSRSQESLSDMDIDEMTSFTDSELMEDFNPDLFGGAGRGLRSLIAQVDLGHDLVSAGHLVQKYIKPAVSEVFFSNRNDGRSGSVIKINTSREPIKNFVAEKKHVETESTYEEVKPVSLSLDNSRFGKQRAIKSAAKAMVEEGTTPKAESNQSNTIK